MECNKEEALRAKEIAERKLEQKDYSAAQKLALKAQRLFPQLENVTQLLTVCAIHTSAVCTNGLPDWYGILSIEPGSDDVAIKKQYRKLALLLHPDKNKLPGAEAAFKLIGEANNILSDRAKRSIYDIKRGNLVRSKPTFNPNPNPHPNYKPPQNGGVQPTRNNASSSNTRPNPNPNFNTRPNPRPAQTFWTACPFCQTRFQYYSSMADKQVLCMTCKTNFIARVVCDNIRPRPAVPSHSANRNGNANSNPNRNPNPNPNPEPSPNPNIPNSAGSNNATVQKSGPNVTSAPSVENPNPNGDMSSPNRDATRVNGAENESGAQAGCSTPLRRSMRNKSDVKYNVTENGSDKGGASGNDVSTPAKKPRVEGEGCASSEPNQREERRKESKKETESKKDEMQENGFCNGRKPETVEVGTDSDANEDTNTNANTETKMDTDHDTNTNTGSGFVYPDPEFCDFESLKSKDKFSVDQIWALYDNMDGMPRFYARIRYVYVESEFKVRYTWLEHDPKTDSENSWSDEELPVGCGNYILGDTDIAEDRLLFSHLVRSSEKGKNRVSSYVIYPKKGEVWAIFKDWSVNWSSEPDLHRIYEYEVVEVLSDFSASGGISVIPLVKVDGFVSLFVRARDEVPFCVQPGEMLRFSHSVLSYRLNGTEREGVPEGSLELDVVSLPSNYATTFPSVKPELLRSERKEEGNSVPNGRCESAAKLSASNLELVEYPDSEFHNFESNRIPNRFQRGQIWALYSDLDSFPKYYGWIKKVESETFKVHVIWLEACPQCETEKKWLGADLPIGAGMFRVAKQNITFETTETFSHLVEPFSHSARGNKYEILPRVGEIWAVYKNCTAGTVVNFPDCEYEIVEVKEQNEDSARVSVLQKVEGYRSVFKLVGTGTVQIPVGEFVRFSHKIPAFALTEERGGKLRGFWELDPAAVPDSFLYTS